MSWASCFTPDFRVASIVGAAAGTTAPNDRRLIENLTGTPTFVSGSLDAGRYALHIDPSGAATNIGLATMAASPRYSGLIFRFKTPAAFVAATTQLCRVVASTAGESVTVRVTSAGLLQFSTNNGSTFTSSGATLAPGTVYALEVFVDWNTGTTHTIKILLNGTEIVNTTGGTAIVTGAVPTIGTNTTTGDAYDYADMATYNDVAQYGVIGPDWRVYGIQPVSDGTHSMTANDFQDDASANLTNATTTSWSKVDDAPTAAPTVTDFVKQVVVRSTSYMEWVLAQVPSGTGAPLLVCLAAAMHPVGAATANAAQFRLNSGGNLSTEAAIDTSIASNTLEYRKHHYTAEPGSSAAWTLAMVNALRARFGYDGTSIAAPPALDSIMAFVLAPVTQVSATAAAISATSATAAMTVTHHQYALTAAAASATSATAAMTVTHHQYALVATATSATSATAALTVTHHQTVITASAASATGATAHMDAGVELTATATSATSAAATLTVSAATQTGGGTTAWGPHVHVPRFLQARATSQTRANATMTVARSRRQQEDDAALLLLHSL